MGNGRAVRGLLLKYRLQYDNAGGTNLPPTRRFATLAKWGVDFRWQERIARSEQLDREAEQAARQHALEAQAQLWAERRLAVKERDWQQAERIRKLADQILDESPKFVKSTRRLIRGSGGEADREIITVALDGKLMVQATETASKLQRLAAEMETEHIQVDKVEITADELAEARKRALDLEQELLGDPADAE